MTKYAINISQTNIGITALNLQIPIGGWAKLANEDVNHDEVKEAIRRSWIKIELKEPEPAQVFQPTIEFSEPPVAGSRTIPGKDKKETE